MRRMALFAVCGFVCAGLTGCGEDNEKSFASTQKVVESTKEAPKSQMDYMKQYGAGPAGKSGNLPGNYPGMNRKPASASSDQ